LFFLIIIADPSLTPHPTQVAAFRKATSTIVAVRRANENKKKNNKGISGIRIGGSIDSKPGTSTLEGGDDEADEFADDAHVIPVGMGFFSKDAPNPSWRNKQSSQSQKEEHRDVDLDDFAGDDHELRPVAVKASGEAGKKTWVEERVKISGNRGAILSAKFKALGFETDQDFCAFEEDDQVLRVRVSLFYVEL
jgi:hypothetical protein